MVLIFTVLGILSIGIAQQVVITTTTTVITLPEKTTTTVISHAGTTETKTVILGAYKVVHAEIRPDQECVVVIKGEPQPVMKIPGTTIPGITTTMIIPTISYAMTITQVEGGTTLITTGARAVDVKTTMAMGPMTTVFAMPVVLYGEILEYCEKITVTIIDSFEVKEPMILSITLQGYTLAGMTLTVPEMPITGPMTMTETTTYPGTTYTTTIEEKGRAMVTTITLPEILETKTITLPGETITKTITYTTTLPGTGTPTKTEMSGTETAKTTSVAATATTQAAEGIPTILLVIVAIVAIVVILGIAFLKRLKR